MGCAVGGSTLALSRSFSTVTGLDFSHAFVAAAAQLAETGSAPYTCLVEGSRTVSHTATLPLGVNPKRVTYLQGDACALPPTAALGGPFSVVHAANLLCRLPKPRDFLARLPDLVVPGGLVVLVSPFSWLPQYTKPQDWVGGGAEPSLPVLVVRGGGRGGGAFLCSPRAPTSSLPPSPRA